MRVHGPYTPHFDVRGRLRMLRNRFHILFSVFYKNTFVLSSRQSSSPRRASIPDRLHFISVYCNRKYIRIDLLTI